MSSSVDDNLPPVQAPSAGFLMQLFVVPMVIVVVIVAVCLMFNWLAHMGTKPEDLIDDLGKLNAGSWQKAMSLNNMLNHPSNAELRSNAAMAQRLATILDEQIDGGDMTPESIRLRMYLATALGVFEVETGLNSLLEAAETQRTPEEAVVRHTALEALARRAEVSNTMRTNMRNNKPLMSLLSKAARETGGPASDADRDAQIRYRAAYALGVIGGDEAIEILNGLLSDAQQTVRFNAATGLARHGDPRALPRLLDMLQPELAEDAEAEARIGAAVIVRNALRSIVQFHAQRPDYDLSEAITVIEQLKDDKALIDQLGSSVRMDAIATLSELNDAE